MNGPARKLIFVTSPGFSGTTLFSGVLGRHPEVATVGEMTGLIESVDPATYVCSCGERIQTCSFWEEIERQMEARGESFATNNFSLKFFIGKHRATEILLSRSLHNTWLNSLRDSLVSRLDVVKRERSRIARRNLAFIDSLRAVLCKDVVLDVSKDPIRMHYLAQMREIDLYVIHFVRDARGNAYSFSRNRGSTVLAGAKHWVWVHKDVQRISSGLPKGRFLRVRYEDFCRNPATELRKVQDFCGLKLVDMSSSVDPTSMHLVGNSMRTRGMAGIELDEKWRRELSSKDVDSILRVAGRLNRSFGYSN